jgi:hypothetical protein
MAMESIIAPLLSIVTPIDKHQVATTSSDTGLSVEIHRDIMRTSDEVSRYWQAGRSGRYLVSIGMPLDVAVGSMRVPKDYFPPGEADALNPSEVLRFIQRKNNGELPRGVRAVQPELGQIIQVDERHVYREPPSPNDRIVDYTLLLAHRINTGT